MSIEQIGITAAAVLAGAGVIGVGWKTVRASWRGLRRLGHLVDELLGVEARGSRPAEPGWAARLDQMQADVTKIKAQVFPNGGTSLRDAVDDVRTRLDDHLTEADQARRVFEDHMSAGGVHVQVPIGASLTVAPPPGSGLSGSK